LPHSVKLKAESSTAGKKRKRVSFSTADGEAAPEMKPLKKPKKANKVPRDEVELKKADKARKSKKPKEKEDKKVRRRSSSLGELPTSRRS
jgi:hypothetical protein